MNNYLKTWEIQPFLKKSEYLYTLCSEGKRVITVKDTF